MTKTIKNNKTATFADQIIGAAQELELAAKRLRETARNIRREGLTQYDANIDPISHFNDWQRIAVKDGALKAMRQLGATVDHLSEVVFETR